MFSQASALVDNDYLPNTQPATWKPVLAFVVHSDGSQSLVSQHEVSGAGALMQGTLASPYELAQVASRCAESEGSDNTAQKPEIQPENILYENADTLVWYVPSQVRSMWFRTRTGGSERLMVPWPSLLFKARKDDPALQVLALRYKRRPKASDPLCVAPLLNVYRDGRVCQGAAKLPDDRSIRTLDAMQATIYDTYFTHLNQDQVLKGVEGTENTVRYWETLSREGQKRFPAKDLLPFKQGFLNEGDALTVGQFIASI